MFSRSASLCIVVGVLVVAVGVALAQPSVNCTSGCAVISDWANYPDDEDINPYAFRIHTGGSCIVATMWTSVWLGGSCLPFDPPVSVQQDKDCERSEKCDTFNGTPTDGDVVEQNTLSSGCTFWLNANTSRCSAT
jgi:hypothetical protein